VQSNYKFVVAWLLTGCLLIYVMVVVGGITRLTGSGLSITKWKVITGTLPPLTAEAWQQEFESYKQTPQFKLINSDFTLSDFKGIFWWEYIHRLTGRLIGFVFLIPFLWFWIRKKLPDGFMKKALVLFVLGGLQGFLGWFMVMSGLSENIYVSHYRLAVHLISAFTVFGFTFWYALDIAWPVSAVSADGSRELKKTAILLFFVILLQLIYGAFVAGLKAGYGYPTWPKMGNQWVPDDVIALEPLWKNFLEGHAGVQFIHRYLAYVVVLIVGIIFFRASKMQITARQRKIINTLGVIVLVQFSLGVITLLYGVPIVIAVLHQTGAFFLFATSLLLVHSAK
jgi:heme a synthase